MPRLRHSVTGVVVSCSAETAARLPGRTWLPVTDEPAPAGESESTEVPAKPAATRKRAPRRRKEG